MCVCLCMESGSLALRELYADIIVDISHEKVDRPFQYRVPERLWDVLEVGMCVEVPFGRGDKVIKGYVTAIGEECKFDPKRTKDILGIVEKGVSVEDKMIALAAWIRKNYGSTMIQALKTVLPGQTIRTKAGTQTFGTGYDRGRTHFTHGRMRAQASDGKSKIIKRDDRATQDSERVGDRKIGSLRTDHQKFGAWEQLGK